MKGRNSNNNTSDSFADFGSPDRELTSADIKQAINKPLAKSVTLDNSVTRICKLI